MTPPTPTHRRFHLTLLLSLVLSSSALQAQPLRPNFVIIFADDMGYADISPYGARTATPILARMAKEGVRFTDFYVAQPVCSASRAALLTGCYPNRIGILGALNPHSKEGIHSNEVTLAELLKTRGYATAIYGKWHLGYQPQFLPTRHGFDDYFGLPYSNDMWQKHPAPTQPYPPLPLIEGERTIETDPDQRQLTTWYTQRAVKFIEKNRNQPFFLYVPHNMPHVPLFVSSKHRGKSKLGLYGDVIQELDWSVGEILKSLKKNGLDERTLVIFASDNGPWLSPGSNPGSGNARNAALNLESLLLQNLRDELRSLRLLESELRVTKNRIDHHLGEVFAGIDTPHSFGFQGVQRWNLS